MTAYGPRFELVQCIYCNLIVAVHRIWNIALACERMGNHLSELN